MKTLKKIIPILILFACIRANAEDYVSLQDSVSLQGREEASLLSVGDMTNSQFIEYNINIANGLYPDPTLVEREWTAGDGISADLIPAIIDNNPIVPNEANIDTTAIVGQIEIESGVSRYGSKTYRVPIKVPQGIREEVTPEISLDYDSHNVNLGLLGHGWRLSGVPQIERTAKILEIDNITSGIEMNLEDAFSIDGMRLIEENRTDDYIIYESFRGNIKAKAYISNNVITHFDVWYPDGRRSRFGYETTSENRLTYPIVWLKDEFGNTINYEYIKGNSDYLIKKITYSNCEIIFDNEDIDEYNLEYSDKYIAGIKIDTPKVIKTITTKIGGNEIRQYQIVYKKELYFYYLMPAEIKCKIGNEKLNPLRFYYGSCEMGYAGIERLDKGLILSYQGSSQPNVSKGFIDNGGKEGIIAWPNKASYWRLKRENPASPDPSVYVDLLTDSYMNMYSGEEDILVYTGLGNETDDGLMPIKTESGFIDVLTADIDGSGQESIIRINNTAENGRDIVRFKVWKKGTTNLLEHICTQTFDTGASRTDISGNESVKPKYFYAGNFLGDGKMRIAAFVGVETMNIYPRDISPGLIHLFDIESGTYESIYGTLYHHVCYPSHEQPNKEEAYRQSDRIIVMDCNNDGKDEICTITDDGFYIYEIEQSIDEELSIQKICVQKAFDERINLELINQHCMSIGDFNGDSYPDIFIGANDYSEEMSGRYSYIYYSKGNGNFEKTQTSKKLYECIAHDNNKDGITDLIAFYQGAIQVNEITNGEVFEYVAAPFDSENQTPIPVNIVNQASDYNISLLSIDFSSGKVIKYEGDENYLDYIKCVGMVNSLGVVEENRYRRIGVGNDADFYSVTDSLADYPNMAIHQGLMPVERTIRMVGGAIKSSHNYSYNTAEVNLRGLGFMGFRKIISRDHNGDIIQRFYDPDNWGVMTREVTPTGEQVNTWTPSWRTLNETTGAKVLNLNLTYSIYRDMLTENITRQGYNYDSYGNLTGQTRTDADNFITQHNISYRNNPTIGNGYVIGLPTQHSVRYTPHGGVAITETTTLGYQGTQPRVKMIRKNSALISTNRYGYTSQGKLSSDTLINGNSNKRQIQRYTYDNYGRQLMSIDRYGLATSYAYYDNGRLKSVTTPIGVVTTYTYDSLGRIVGITDGETTAVTNYEWSDSVGLYKTTISGNYSPTQIIYYDCFGREIRKAEKRPDGSLLKTDVEYNLRGDISRQTLPYKSIEPTQWITYHYDNNGRLLRRQEPSGRNLRHTYNGNAITTTEDNISTTRTYNPRGNLVSVTDQTGTIIYNYAADGLPTSIVSSSGATTTIGYDTSRRRDSLTDPSFGQTTYQYDADGNLVKETYSDGRSITYGYDAHNRLIGKTTPEFSTTYSYDNYNRPVSETSTNGTQTNINYDTRNRIVNQMQRAGSTSYTRTYHYTAGKLSRIIHNSSKTGVMATENYDYTHNHLSRIFSTTSQGDTITVWKYVEENDMGLLTRSMTGKVTHKTDYNSYGLLTSQRSYLPRLDIYVDPNLPVVGPVIRPDSETNVVPGFTQPVATLHHFAYTFNPQTGNLTGREDKTRTLGAETFTYDNMNRLLTSPGQNVNYSSSGNITAKSDYGVYAYTNNSRPYAVTSVDLAQNAETPSALNISYTSFRRPQQITTNNGTQQITESYTYDASYNRVQSTLRRIDLQTGRMTMRTSFSLGGCYDNDGVAERLWLGGGYYGAPVVLEVTDTMSYRYVMRDHLGSITHVYTAEPIPTLLQELSYDAWGRLRNPDTHEAYTSDNVPTPILGRGYTGHRHIAGIGLIDMNARLYDPMLGRFLSPDPYIQSPDCPQNYNRYTYCLNNPLRYTDPTGEIIKIGENEKVYKINMSTRGLNKFEINVVDALNLIFKNGGKTLIEELLNEPKITYHIIPAEDDRVGVGGYINESDMGTQNVVVYIYTNNGTKMMILSIAHELMHCFQNQKGQGGQSIHNEVEAYIFQYLVASNSLNSDNPNDHIYNWVNTTDSSFGELYQAAISDIINENFSFIKFQIAVWTFKFGAMDNSNGLYNNYPLYTNGNYLGLLIKSLLE